MVSIFHNSAHCGFITQKKIIATRENNQAKEIYLQLVEDFPELYLNLAQIANEDGAIEEAFAPEQTQSQESPEVAAAGEAQAPENAPGGASPQDQGQLPEGLQASGRIQGVAPGQQGMAPGGRPSLQTLLAGLSSSGAPELSAGVIRRTAI